MRQNGRVARRLAKARATRKTVALVMIIFIACAMIIAGFCWLNSNPPAENWVHESHIWSGMPCHCK